MTERPERAVRRRRVHRGRAVDFWTDLVRLPSGAVAVREYLGHPGAVAVVAVAGGPPRDPDLLFVRQFRYPVQRFTLELPAGKIDAGESPVRCVRRELEEETGFRAGRVRRLMSFWPTPAFATEVIHLYLADRLTPGRLAPDEDEFLTLRRLPLSRALSLAWNGRIKDSKTLIGLWAADRWVRRLPAR